MSKISLSLTSMGFDESQSKGGWGWSDCQSLRTLENKNFPLLHTPPFFFFFYASVCHIVSCLQRYKYTYLNGLCHILYSYCGSETSIFKSKVGSRAWRGIVSWLVHFIMSRSYLVLINHSFGSHLPFNPVQMTTQKSLGGILSHSISMVTVTSSN